MYGDKDNYKAFPDLGEEIKNEYYVLEEDWFILLCYMI
jgi:hypothetical protein